MGLKQEALGLLLAPPICPTTTDVMGRRGRAKDTHQFPAQIGKDKVHAEVLCVDRPFHP